MDDALDLLLLESGPSILTEDGRALALESYKFRWQNERGITYDPTDVYTVYAEQLNSILDRLDALE